MSGMDTNQKLTEYTYVAFDTETSGAYPIGYDVVEFGAVKFIKGKEVARLQFLLKPREAMSEFIMGIHGITNEMVLQAPVIKDKVREIADFFKGAVLLAHHAPFDLGFLAVDFEKYAIPFPTEPVLCTSLLSRKIITGTENHKLQTLVKFLNIDGGAAHRAADDAMSCMLVGLECFRRMGETATLADALKLQAKVLSWSNYSVISNSKSTYKVLVEAIGAKKNAEICYEKGGIKGGERRQVFPIGIVRNPDGDYLMAKCLRDGESKRFYMAKILDAAVMY